MHALPDAVAHSHSRSTHEENEGYLRDKLQMQRDATRAQTIYHRQSCVAPFGLDDGKMKMSWC